MLKTRNYNKNKKKMTKNTKCHAVPRALTVTITPQLLSAFTFVVSNWRKTRLNQDPWDSQFDICKNCQKEKRAECNSPKSFNKCDRYGLLNLSNQWVEDKNGNVIFLELANELK